MASHAQLSVEDWHRWNLWQDWGQWAVQHWPLGQWFRFNNKSQSRGPQPMYYTCPPDDPRSTKIRANHLYIDRSAAHQIVDVVFAATLDHQHAFITVAFDIGDERVWTNVEKAPPPADWGKRVTWASIVSPPLEAHDFGTWLRGKGRGTNNGKGKGRGKQKSDPY